MAKTLACSYLRVSGKGQIEGDGFPRQREAIEKYAKANRIEVVTEYRDEGVSGKAELADREGLAALLDAVESGPIKLVLVERADRMARNLMVNEVIIDRFRKTGCRVIEVDDGRDLTADDDEPTAVLVRQILAVISHFERSVIVLKLRAARERIRRTAGRCEGRKPFGTRPGEAETLARMQELRRKPKGEERNGFHRIAALLNEEGRPSRSGKPWTATAVGRILSR